MHYSHAFLFMRTALVLRADLGKIHYLPTRYGTAEALGQSLEKYNSPSYGSLASSSKTSLSRSPSAAELDALLLRRSRARGRGGQLGAWAEKVQPKWSVLFAAGSSGAVSMKPTG
jgi:hypothetical protein